MPYLKQIKAQINTTETIQAVTQALGDIATSKIKQTRNYVTHNIYFFQEISKLYKTVKQIALHDPKYRLVYLSRERKKLDKTLFLLITSNQHFYGSLDSDLVKFYINQTKTLQADRLVIGTSGVRSLKANGFNLAYEPLNFKKNNPDFEELKSLASKVFSYKRIFAFHTKFETLLSQTPTMTDINYSELDKAASLQKSLYITEPEIEKIMDFFESQIVILLFQAIFLEVDIAHLAARMITMNQAELNASKELQREKKELLKIKKQVMNLRILETYTGRKIENI